MNIVLNTDPARITLDVETPVTYEEVFTDTDFTVGWSNEGSGDDWLFVSDEMQVLVLGTTSKKARRSVTIESGETYRIKTEITVQGSVGQVRVYLGGVQLAIVPTQQDTRIISEVVITSNDDYSFIEYEAEDLEAALFVVDIFSVQLEKQVPL